MAIKLFVTGGTIDCERIEGKDKYIFEKTYLPTMLKQGRCNADINLKILMLKDSIYMTDLDRKKILQSCKDCKEDKIVITHGTDALFNLGGGIIAVQLLPKGVYITMNGKIFLWNKVRKNKKLGVFETLK